MHPADESGAGRPRGDLTAADLGRPVFDRDTGRLDVRLNIETLAAAGPHGTATVFL
jgi:hypothetical protein